MPSEKCAEIIRHLGSKIVKAFMAPHPFCRPAIKNDSGAILGSGRDANFLIAVPEYDGKIP